MTSSSIPQSLRELLSKLEFIGMVGLNQKVCMNSMSFVDADSWVGAIRRGLAGEGRKSMILHLQSMVTASGRALEQYHKTDYLPLLVKNLANAKSGIQHLIKTYEGSPGTVADLNICIADIDMQLKPYRHLLAQVQVSHSQPVNIPSHSHNSVNSSPMDEPPLPSTNMFD